MFNQIQQAQQVRRRPAPTRLGGMRPGGEIVEVQGGHIVRATGRKDRHSKVCTAKGPRDRRVRLAAHTAIQFYDVQDRLGYDRPSKAVDWLIMNAKSAIDELAQLPAWQPTANNQEGLDSPADSGKRPMGADPDVTTAFTFGAGGSSNTSFLPASLDSDAIADTIKSFFPMAANTAPTPSSSPPVGGYQNYPPDLLSRSSSQDLRLSLQSFENQIIHHHHHAAHHHHQPMGFDTAPHSGWPEQSQRIMVPWNIAETGGGGGGGGGYIFNVPQPSQAVPLQGQFFTQRGPLQSSNSPSVRAWTDPMPPSADHPMHPMFHPMVSSIGFASGGDGSSFSGFRIPARIQGEEERDGMSENPSSASSASHH